MSLNRLLNFLCMTWLLALLVFAISTRNRWPEVSSTGDEVLLEGVVEEVLEQGAIRQTIRLVVDDVPGRVQAEIGGVPFLHVGDRIRVRCEPTPIRDVYTETFRYDRYLAKERVFLVCSSYAPPESVGIVWSFQSRMARMRNEFEATLGRHLAEPHRSLLIGLLYGARSTLPSSVVEDFRRTGTMHIVAVSGFNVMIVTTALLWTLTLFMRRQHAFVLILVGIAGYTVFAGADPGVVRAAIMGALVLLARHIGRPQVALTLFLLAAATMATLNPRVLLDDVGFQLSFAAAAGLTWLSPHIRRWLDWLRPAWIRSILADTAAAITATLPLSLLQFRQFALVAPIANLFVVPLVAPAMIAGGVLSALSIAMDAIGWSVGATAVMLPAYALLDLILTIAHVFAPLPFLDLSV